MEASRLSPASSPLPHVSGRELEAHATDVTANDLRELDPLGYRRRREELRHEHDLYAFACATLNMLCVQFAEALEC